MHKLRDSLPVDVAAHLGAQLPLLVRSVYYDQFQPAKQPSSCRDLDEFVAEVQEWLTDVRQVNVKDALDAVFATEGRRRCFGEIPAAIDALQDDPFRSLASALQRAGGSAKKSTPFREFAWVGFLRCYVYSEVLAADFEGERGQAPVLARSPAASDLPGWMPQRQWKPDASASSASPNVDR